MPCQTPTNPNTNSAPHWATELLAKFETMSIKLNSIDDIKGTVSRID